MRDIRMIRTVLALLLLSNQAVAFADKDITDSTSETIHIVEWLPFNAHNKIINYMTEAMKDQPALTYNRINAYGDKEELVTQLKELAQDEAKVLITFGDFTTQTALDLCPKVPVIALFVESPEALEKPLSTHTASFSLLESKVKPGRCLDVATELRKNTNSIGIIHTDKFSPNQHLFETLKAKAAERNIKVTQIRVDPGFCRTDSDFEKVIRKTYEEHAIDVLIVPKDPNCDRFGHTIYNTAEKLGIVSIGSDSTIGKGFVSGFAPDYPKLAEGIVSALTSLNDTGSKKQHVHISSRFIYDPKMIGKFESLNSIWLKENAKKYR